MTRSFDFLQAESFTNKKGRLQGHVQKGLQECLYVNLFYLLPLPPTPSIFSAWKTPDNTDEDPE
jgi:hypothetical protein